MKDIDNENNGLKTVREGGKEYLVARIKSDDTFTGKMIVKNDIGSMLDATSREFNGDAYIYYDVSGRVRFCDMFSGDKDIMEREDVERLCRSFERLTGDVREYLLDIEETRVSVETLFYDPEKKEYEFLYVPDCRPGICKCKDNTGEGDDDPGELAAISGSSSFNEGVRAVWERVMEKFNYHSDIESIARVYDIYQKVSMQSFDPEEVFAHPGKNRGLIKGEEVVPDTCENSLKGEIFSKEHLKESIAGICEPETKSSFSYFEVEEDTASEAQSESRGKGSLFDGLKMKLAGSAGFFSGMKTGEESKIDEISRNMDEESKPGYILKEYLAVNSGNIFKVLMCVAVLFLVLALMPDSVTFKPPVSACVGIFLVCVAVAVYARKLGKEHAEDQVKGEV